MEFFARWDLWEKIAKFPYFKDEETEALKD